MMTVSFPELNVVVRGAGDLGSGVLYRLHRFGIRPVALERAEPLTVRRQVAFASAVYEGTVEVEGVRARLVDDPGESDEDVIPVLVDESGSYLDERSPDVLVDATMVRYPDRVMTDRSMASLTIALGPGFVAGEDVDYVVETNRGHRLGRVIEKGEAESPTGEPASVLGKSHERVLRAPADGMFKAHRSIGDRVTKGDLVGTVAGEDVRAEVDGVIRGLIHPDTTVEQGLKLGDVDPRGDRGHVDLISDKSRAVGGGVLEAIGYHYHRRS
jgi:xanthine dehydrogenase accessory factor